MAALALTWTSALGFTPSGAAPSMRRSTSSRPVARLVAEAKLPAPALLSLPAYRIEFVEAPRTLDRARRRRRGKTDALGVRLLAATLKWGVAHAGDGAILALTSPSAFRTLYDWRKSCYGELSQLTTALEDAASKLQQHVAFTCDIAGARVEHRAKGLLSTFTKVGRGKKPRDILALRLLLPGDDEKACYDAMRAVHRLWTSTGRDYKDYVAAPKANGYRSLHDTVLLPCGRLMEVQIRTARMHEHAESGDASHTLYKGSMGRLVGAMGALSAA